METKPLFELHLFVCTNSRTDKKACFEEGGEDFRAELKERLRKYAPKLRVNKSGCLGVCAKGAAAVLYPMGHWFYDMNDDTIDQIEKLVESHFE